MHRGVVVIVRSQGALVAGSRFGLRLMVPTKAEAFVKGHQGISKGTAVKTTDYRLLTVVSRY